MQTVVKRIFAAALVITFVWMIFGLVIAAFISL
jgi:hypothetical protein